MICTLCFLPVRTQESFSAKDQRLSTIKDDQRAPTPPHNLKRELSDNIEQWQVYSSTPWEIAAVRGIHSSPGCSVYLITSFLTVNSAVSISSGSGLTAACRSSGDIETGQDLQSDNHRQMKISILRYDQHSQQSSWHLSRTWRTFPWGPMVLISRDHCRDGFAILRRIRVRYSSAVL